MQLDPDACYRALRARDARFDGRFFTAVRSTGIYCRPICPARTPRRENCWFVPCAAAAQEAGYRPCLRCRPEASPGTPAWQGTSATVSRALRLISDGALDEGSVATLAARLGIGDRHLRRLFLEHLGASPVTVAQTRRLLFAKKLIDDTALPMVEVAAASGFASVRRFNDAIRQTYARPPRELRRAARDESPLTEGVTLTLAYRPPYPWKRVLGYLAARAFGGVEQVREDAYRRSFTLADAQGWFEVRQPEPGAPLAVRVHATGTFALIRLAERVRQLFDLGADPQEIQAPLEADPRLRRALRKLPGVRVPGCWDGFELAVRAILGQQVSVAGATTLARRLAERFGHPLDAAIQPHDGEPLLAFPSAETLAEADIQAIGMPRTRARAVGALAAAVAGGKLSLRTTADPEQERETLLALPGVGPWTVEYIAMRALREPDAFPETDLGLLRAFGPDATPAALLRAAEAWRPWRAYAAMLLWQASAAD
jgi:AraC family transcriptional regulator of adaptative response / DNA-3-methyladenine glycosylase II